MNAKQHLENQNEIVKYGNIVYSINKISNTASVLGYIGSLPKITIPSSIKDESKEYYITSISNNAFYESEVTTVNFASDSKLQTIESYAFSLSAIEDITIPTTVTNIGENSFCSCKQLKQVLIPSDSKLQTIEKEAFAHTNITSITIPSSVTKIGESSFHSCKQLKQILIPNDSKLQTIENSAFYETPIESITIPSELIDLKEG